MTVPEAPSDQFWIDYSLALPVPLMCDCVNRGQPSPWHCQCSRWKPSCKQQCEVCEKVDATRSG